MNPIDAVLLPFINQLVQRSVIFDHAIVYLEGANIFKGGVFLAFLWAIWLQPASDQMRRRKVILATLTGCAFAILAARILALTLPFRIRPLNDTTLAFQLPHGAFPTLETWSSFPSDHAALFVGLCTGCFLLSLRTGILASIYALIVVMFPRVYVGFHYPTDLLAGGLLGILMVGFANFPLIRERLGRFGLGWVERHPLSFYFCLFLATYQFVVLFDDIRTGGKFAWQALRFLQGGAWP